MNLEDGEEASLSICNHMNPQSSSTILKQQYPIVIVHSPPITPHFVDSNNMSPAHSNPRKHEDSKADIDEGADDLFAMTDCFSADEDSADDISVVR